MGGLLHSPGIASFQPVACYFRFLAFRFPQKSACNLVGLGTVLCNLYSSTTCHCPGWLAPMSKLSFTQHRCFSGVLYTNPNKISNTREIPQNYHILCINCFIPLNDPCFLQSFFFLFLPVAKLLISPRWWFRKGRTHQQVPQLHRISANFTRCFRCLLAKKIFWCQWWRHVLYLPISIALYWRGHATVSILGSSCWKVVPACTVGCRLLNYPG